jgi:chromosome segregation ATPase
MQENSDELQRENGALDENLYNTREDFDAAQWNKDKLVGLESRMKMLLDGEPSNQNTHAHKDSDTFISEYKEWKTKYPVLQRQYSALKIDLNHISEKCKALQRDRDKLVGIEEKIQMMMGEELCFRPTTERNASSSEEHRLKTKSEEINLKYIALKDNLNVTGEQHEDLQRAKEELSILEVRMKLALDEKSSIEEAYLILTRETDTLRLEREQLETSYLDIKRECLVLKENLSTIREELDALQRDKDDLVGLLNKQSDNQKTHLTEIQENHNLKSNQVELETNVQELTEKCLNLKAELNAIKEECETLRKVRDESLDQEGKIKVTLGEKPSIEEAYLIVTRERDTLRSEREELVTNYHDIKQECLALKESLGALREERDALQRDKDVLQVMEGKMKVPLDKESDNQEALLAVMQENHNLKSNQVQLETNVQELTEECLALKEELNEIKERYTLQTVRDESLDLEVRMELKWDEKSSTEEAYLIITRERDILRSEREELVTNYDQIKRESIALKESLSALREERDALQRDKDELIGLEVQLKMLMDEKSNIEKAHLIVTQERDTLRSEQEELKTSYYQIKRECLALKVNLSALREEYYTLLRDKDELVVLEDRMNMTMDGQSVIQKPHIIVSQERDSVRSEHSEMDITFDRIERIFDALKENIISMREECKALLFDKSKLEVRMGRGKVMLNEVSYAQIALEMVTHERDSLRSQCDMLKVKYDTLERKCSALNEDLNNIRREHSALQKDRDLLIDVNGRIEMMTDEEFSIQEANFIVSQERGIWRSVQQDLEISFDNLKRNSISPTTSSSSIREKSDALHGDEDELVGMRATWISVSHEKSST